MYQNNGLADWRLSAEELQIIITKTANKIKYLNWFDLICKS